MTYRFDGYNYLMRLEKDDLLMQSLLEFAGQVKQSFWLSGAGGAQWAELGFYDLPNRRYEWKRFDQLMEITSLQGNLAWEHDQAVWHVHATLADAGFHAIGGHVKELCVAGTCEILLHAVQGEPIRRVHDETIGLSLLEL